jgi:5-methylcytosine-specific restriction endonuclease McrA
MARPRLRATFFVDPGGVVIAKARSLTPRQRYEIFDRDGGVCRLCERAVVKVTNMDGRSYHWNGKIPSEIDHVFPRSRGGQNDSGNLRLLCARCNSSKGAK